MEALLHPFARCVALVIESIAIATHRGQVEKRVISLGYARWLVAEPPAAECVAGGAADGQPSRS